MTYGRWACPVNVRQAGRAGREGAGCAGRGARLGGVPREHMRHGPPSSLDSSLPSSLLCLSRLHHTHTHTHTPPPLRLSMLARTPKRRVRRYRLRVRRGRSAAFVAAAPRTRYRMYQCEQPESLMVFILALCGMMIIGDNNFCLYCCSTFFSIGSHSETETDRDRQTETDRQTDRQTGYFYCTAQIVFKVLDTRIVLKCMNAAASCSCVSKY